MVIHEAGKPRELDDVDEVTQASGAAAAPAPIQDDHNVRDDDQTQIAARSGAGPGRGPASGSTQPPKAKPPSGLAARVQAFAEEERDAGPTPAGPDEDTAAAPPRERTEPTKVTEPAQPPQPEKPAQSKHAKSAGPTAPPSSPPAPPKPEETVEADEEETESQELDAQGKPVRKGRPD